MSQYMKYCLKLQYFMLHHITNFGLVPAINYMGGCPAVMQKVPTWAFRATVAMLQTLTPEAPLLLDGVPFAGGSVNTDAADEPHTFTLPGEAQG